MKQYRFYGSDCPDLEPINETYQSIRNPKDLYDLLSGIWCEYSCAPRYRSEWSTENKTLGQCSITSFLVQDIYGGNVYGIPLPEGGYHCYNEVNGNVFDITSEQFGDTRFVYDLKNLQSREEHFASEEKYGRYRYLCEQLGAALQNLKP